MHILTILAFVAALILGLFFRTLVVVAFAGVFVAALFVFGPEFGLSPVSASLFAVIAINIGYLAGALLAWRRSRPSGTDPLDK